MTFKVPPGNPGHVSFFRMIVGAPGGACEDGVQCYADGAYTLAGWGDIAEAEASPTQGTLFNVDLSGTTVIDSDGTSNGGVPGGPLFPLSYLMLDAFATAAICPATGCVIALISDVSAAPGLTVETHSRSVFPVGTTDRALCPVGCEGGLPIGTAAVEFTVGP